MASPNQADQNLDDLFADDLFSMDEQPSGSSAPADEQIDDILEEAVPAPVEQKKDKKEKKKVAPKVKAERPKKPVKPKGPTVPSSPADHVLLATGILAFVVLLAYIGLSFPKYGAMFAGIQLLIGIMAVLVPFLLWKARKMYTVFEVLLGISLIALAIGSSILLAELASYDFKIKAAMSFLM